MKKPLPSHPCARSRCGKPGLIIPGKRMRLCLAHSLSKPSKYKNVRVESALVGRSFDSRAERKRGEELALMEKAGEIRNLRYQVTIPLGINGVAICGWRADFVYEEKAETSRQFFGDAGVEIEFWREVWEDVKGFRTPLYELKRKLVKAIYGVEIRETGTERKKVRRG